MDTHNNVEKNKIASGTQGHFDLELDGRESEVAIDYDIKLAINEKPTNLKFYVDSEYKYEIPVNDSIMNVKGSTSGTFINEDGTLIVASNVNPVTIKYTDDTINKSTNDYYFYDTKNFIEKTFFVASRYIWLRNDDVVYYVRTVTSGHLAYNFWTFKSGGTEKNVLPVVILRSNIKTNGRDSSGGLEFRYLKIKGIEQAKKYFTEWEIREKDYSELILTEFLENPEVVNMSEKDIENEKDESIKTTKKAIKQAKDTLEQISKDEHEQELARLRKKYIMDQNAIQEYGYCQGVEDGKYESMNDTAKKMLAKKMPIDVIIEITGLSKEEIENIKKGIKN